MFSSRNLFRALALLLASAAIVGGALPRARAQQQPPAQQKPKQDDSQSIDDDEVLTVDTSLTNILFSATDRDKRFYSTLSKEDIRVVEDGVAQEIFTFQKQVDLPITFAIVIDTSQSQEYTLPEEKSAARSFVDDVLRPAKDEVAVVSFTGDVTLEQGLTGNVSSIRSAIDKVEFVPPAGYIGGGVVVGTPPISGNSRAGSTALWDAILVTCDEVLSGSSLRTRRAIVLLTDGVDTSSKYKLQDAVDKAIKTETLVF